MHTEPSIEEVKSSKLIITRCNEDEDDASNVDRGYLIDSKKELRFAKCVNVTQRDQFGLSLKISFMRNQEVADNYDRKQYFIKLPAGLGENAENVTLDKVKDHYETVMMKRFETEFSKFSTFNHIAKSSEKNLFSIQPPLALCVLNVSIEGNLIRIPGLIYEYINHHDISKKTSWKAHSIENFFKFAKGLTRAVQLIHNNGILHSFLVPRNIIADGSAKYFIVGFGYSSFCVSKYTIPSIRVSEADRCYRAPECDYKENLGALWFPIDIYSIGAILYKYVLGDAPLDLPKDVSRLKEHIYNKFSDKDKGYRNVNPIFIQNENILKILDRCLRHRPEDRFSCAEELILALEIAEQATGQREKNQNAKPEEESHTVAIYTHLSGIAAQQKQDQLTGKSALRHYRSNALHHLFDSLLKEITLNAIGDAERIQRGHHEIYGHRDALVTSLCRLLGGAESGDLYRTMTLPSYWTNNNLGSNGRFLTMNKHMVRKGLHIERLFLVDKDFHELTESEQEVLEFQLLAEREIEREKKSNHASAGRSKHMPEGSLKIKVKKKEEKDITDFETNGSLVAFLESRSNKTSDKPVPEKCLCLNFVSHGRYEWMNGCKMIEHTIKKIRYWVPNKPFRRNAFLESHTKYILDWESAFSLNEYIGEHAATNMLDLLREGRNLS